MKLSIIIPVYNSQLYIDQCLESIYNQGISQDAFEVIAIDDGSSDNSLEILTNKKTIYKNLQVFSQSNQGVSATRNRGIDLAKGKYIVFIDSDDYIVKNTLKLFIGFVEENSIQIVGFKKIRTQSRDFLETLYDKDKALARLKKVIKGVDYLSKIYFSDSCCTYFIETKFLKESNVRFIEGRIMEDMLFVAQMLSKAERTSFFPLDIYRYVINPNSIWTSTEPEDLKISVEDFVFMTKKYDLLIAELKQKGVDTSILELKKQYMLFNTAKRILKCEFSRKDLFNVVNFLQANSLYPMRNIKKGNMHTKVITYIFNHKNLLFYSTKFYFFFKNSIDYVIIDRYRQNREKRILLKKS